MSALSTHQARRGELTYRYNNSVVHVKHGRFIIIDGNVRVRVSSKISREVSDLVCSVQDVIAFKQF